MKDRLLAFMQYEGLTALRLSELLGVQPSSISHILSGRNKPGFDFIDKFIRRFPNVNIEWLVSNQGQMLKDEMSVEVTPVGTDSQSLFDSASASVALPSIPEQISLATHEQQHRSEEKPVAPQTPARNTTAENWKSEEIDRIMIFYKDKSFAVYHPKE